VVANGIENSLDRLTTLRRHGRPHRFLTYGRGPVTRAIYFFSDFRHRLLA